MLPAIKIGMIRCHAGGSSKPVELPPHSTHYPANVTTMHASEILVYLLKPHSCNLRLRVFGLTSRMPAISLALKFIAKRYATLSLSNSIFGLPAILLHAQHVIDMALSMLSRPVLVYDHAFYSLFMYNVHYLYAMFIIYVQCSLFINKELYSYVMTIIYK